MTPGVVSPDVLTVQRWPSEIPLLILVGLASAGIWLLLAVTIIGFFYVLLVVMTRRFEAPLRRYPATPVKIAPNPHPPYGLRQQGLVCSCSTVLGCLEDRPGDRV